MYKIFQNKYIKEITNLNKILIEKNIEIENLKKELLERKYPKGLIHKLAIALEECNKKVVKKVEKVSIKDIEEYEEYTKNNSNSIVLISKYTNEHFFVGNEILLLIYDGLKTTLTNNSKLIHAIKENKDIVIFENFEKDCKICYKDFISNDYIKICTNCNTSYCTKCYIKLMYKNFINDNTCMKCPYCTCEQPYLLKKNIDDIVITDHIDKEIYRNAISKEDANDIIEYINTI